MFVITPNTSWLEVITGPMFSGKSELIAQKIKRLDYYNKFTASPPIRYIILRPDTDTRPEDIRATPYPEWKTVSSCDLGSAVPDAYDVIFLDEAHFFKDSIVLDIKSLLRLGKHVVVAGLDKDYTGWPFAPFMEWAIATSDECTKLTAICVMCGQDATMTSLVTDEDLPVTSNILVESDKIKYVPVCRAHHIR